jgi:hypothetical protein
MTHDAFNRTISLVNQGNAQGTLTQEHLDELFSIADRISRQDPFGYIAATMKARRDLTVHFMARAKWETEDDRASALAIENLISTMPASDVIFIAQAIREHQPDEAKRNADLALMQPLLDVFDADALTAARAMTSEIAPLLASNNLEAIQRSAAPDIMQLQRRSRTARQDLRDALRSLRPEQEEPATTSESRQGTVSE